MIRSFLWSGKSAVGWGFALSAMLVSATLATFPGEAVARENPLFAHTHRLPSPFTLPAGRLVLGTEAALGVTDFFQVGTSILRDFYQVYNVNAKASLVDREEFAAAITLGFETYNLKDISPLNPDYRISSWLPGAVTAFSFHPQLALFTGANLRYTQADTSRADGALSSGYVRGAELGADLSFAYDPPGVRRTPGPSRRGAKAPAPERRSSGVGNVLSGGVSYDLNNKLWGIGLSHHWPGFQLGVHYYPAADRYRVQPILSGGMSVDL
jgi:hypothetical protein